MPDWYVTKDGDKTCLELYRRHYSCKNRRARIEQFVGPGEHIVLRTGDGDAVFVWRNYIDDTEPRQEGVECSLFRNEGSLRSSELIRQADEVADFCWPRLRHYTKVNPKRLRGSNPGFCFMAAGWRKCGMTKGGLLILERVVDGGTSPFDAGVESPDGVLVEAGLADDNANRDHVRVPTG